MGDKRNFYRFVSSLTSRPHIAESIIGKLSPHDIASCLRASRDFRRFIIDSLHSNHKLKSNVDTALSRLIVTTGTLAAKQHGPLERANSEPSSTDVLFGFGLDDSLWLTERSKPSAGQNFPPTFVNVPAHVSNLSIYDLTTNNEVVTTSVHIRTRRPRLKIMPCLKVFLQDAGKMHTFGKEDQGVFGILSTDDLQALDIPPEAFNGNDCIYNCEKITEGHFVVGRKLTFCNAAGNLMTDHTISTTEEGVPKLPMKILQQVRY